MDHHGIAIDLLGNAMASPRTLMARPWHFRKPQWHAMELPWAVMALPLGVMVIPWQPIGWLWIVVAMPGAWHNVSVEYCCGIDTDRFVAHWRCRIPGWSVPWQCPGAVRWQYIHGIPPSSVP